MDAIDVAICNIRGAGSDAEVELVRFHSLDYPETLARRLRRAPDLTARDAAELNMLVGRAFAQAVAEAAEGLTLDLVGSHGQTIYHHSRMPGAERTTLQVGDGDVIADCLRVLVMSDFRMGDVAVGGEGAPLTPYADYVLFGRTAGRAVLNLGGMANLTVLGASLDEVIGFDTGPANAPLDRISTADYGERYDAEGEHARAGSYDEALLKQLIDEDAFVAARPPKSTGFEAYGADFVETLRRRSGSSGADLLRLAVEFVVESVARQVPVRVAELLLAGGGARNRFLRKRFEERLAPCRVRLTDELGVPHQAREAIAFAILANDAMCGLPTSLPSVTGAARRRRLGKLSFP